MHLSCLMLGCPQKYRNTYGPCPLKVSGHCILHVRRNLPTNLFIMNSNCHRRSCLFQLLHRRDQISKSPSASFLKQIFQQCLLANSPLYLVREKRRPDLRKLRPACKLPATVFRRVCQTRIGQNPQFRNRIWCTKVSFMWMLCQQRFHRVPLLQELVRRATFTQSLKAPASQDKLWNMMTTIQRIVKAKVELLILPL